MAIPTLERLTQALPVALRSTLSGFGMTFFSANPVSGAFFAGALLLISPKLFGLSALGLASATLVALVLGFDRQLLRMGYFGFNGLLVGIYWGTYSEIGPAHIVALIMAAGVSALLTSLLYTALSRSRLDLPVVSLPSLISAYLAIAVLGQLLSLNCSPAYLLWNFEKVDFDVMGHLKAIGDIDWSALGEVIADNGIAKALLLCGILYHSRILAGGAIGGLLVSLTLSFLACGNYGLWNWGFHFFVSIPVSMALCGFFIALNPSCIVYSLVALIAAVPIWFWLSKAFLLLGAPAFTLPFAVAVYLFLVPLKLGFRPLLNLGLAQIPLIYAGNPEESAWWNRKMRLAGRFWKDVESLREKKKSPDADRSTNRAVELILRAPKVVAFTGAGISTESGIPDYRSGIIPWGRKYDTQHFQYENILKSEDSRQKYWEMSEDFYHLIRSARPNEGHYALATLEQLGRLRCIITQNVDGLHQKAGSSLSRVIELHGAENSVSCLSCAKTYDRAEIHRWIDGGVRVPYCLACQGILKTDSVAFGQPMPLVASQRAVSEASSCDCFIAVGSSLEVQPAAYLPWKAKQNGASLIIITLQPTRYDVNADVIIRARAGEALPKIAARLKELMPLLSTPSTHL